MTLLNRVVDLLTSHQIPHALIGAAALAARGIARSTYDIDLLTADPRVLDRDLWTALVDGGATVDIRRGDQDDPLGGVVRAEARVDRPVDIILGKQQWQRRAVERAETLPDGPPVVTAADLILLKLYAGGRQDLWDVRELLRLPGADQLIAQVSAELTDHGQSMQELWTRARG